MADPDAHDAWFRAKVQEALADQQPAKPHDKVMREARAALARVKAEAVADERERCAKIADDEFGGRCIADKIRGKWVP